MSTETNKNARDTLRQAALTYHEVPRPGKLEIRATKPLANGRDLSLAYSPGVAEACLEIKDDPANASRYTAGGTLWRWCPTGRPCWGWEISVRWPRSR